MNIDLPSRRLKLEFAQIAHRQAIFDLFQDPTTTKYVNLQVPTNPAQVRIPEGWGQPSQPQLAWRAKDSSGNTIGYICVSTVELILDDAAELACFVVSSNRGNRYAEEMVDAVASHLRRNKVEKVQGVVAEGNCAAHASMKRCATLCNEDPSGSVVYIF